MREVHASILAVVVQAALVTVAPGAEESCPSSAQVQSALENHAPRLMAPRPETATNALTLTLSPGLASGDLSLSLVDKAGLVRLYRVLQPPPGDHAQDCAALADTVAFIIDRYFAEVEMPNLPERAPPPPPPPPPTPTPVVPPMVMNDSSPAKSRAPRRALSASVGRRIPGAATDLGGIEFKLLGGTAVTSRVVAGGRPWIDLSAGILGIANRQWSYSRGSGSASSTRVGTDLSFMLGWQVWRGTLLAGPLVSFELMWLNWLDADVKGQVRREIRYGASAGVRTSYLYTWQKRLFARADLAGAMALARYRISTQSDSTITLFESPPASLTLAFGLGIWF